MEGETLCFPFLDCIAIIIIFEIIIHFHHNTQIPFTTHCLSLSV